MNDVVGLQNSKNPKDVLKKPYHRRLQPADDGGYTGTIQEFPGLVAEGNTVDEAMRNLESAALSWIEASLASGREVSDPVDFGGCSGKIALRIPRSLHRQVAEMSELEGVSVNQLLTNAIANFIGAKDMFYTMKKTLIEELDESMSSCLRSYTPTYIVAGVVQQSSSATTWENRLEVRAIPILNDPLIGVAHG